MKLATALERDAARVERDALRAERDAARAELDAARAAAVAAATAAAATAAATAAAAGERLLDVLPIVAAAGSACEVSHCLYLCGVTFRTGNKGATNDMLAKSLERQCGARAARLAGRLEVFVEPNTGIVVRGTTQLTRAAMLNNLPRVLQLVQLGEPLELEDGGNGDGTAMDSACRLGHEHIVRALLDGKYERGSDGGACGDGGGGGGGGRGSGVDVNIRGASGHTPLIWASMRGHEGVARLLVARGANLRLRTYYGGWTALHFAVFEDRPGAVAVLCAAPGAAAAFAIKSRRRSAWPWRQRGARARPCCARTARGSSRSACPGRRGERARPLPPPHETGSGAARRIWRNARRFLCVERRRVCKLV